jgi:peroxiredoxin
MKRPILTAAALAAVLLVSSAAMAGLAPGDDAPDFTLTDTAGKEHNLQSYLDDKQIVVIEWFNPDCPFIKKHHLDHKTMDETFAAVSKEQPVVWLAINSNAKGKQGNGLERNKKAVEEYEMTFPVLLDESGEVGKAYGAKTTPHMFIVTPDGKVAYAGAIDSDKSADKLGETNYVLDFLNATAAGKELPTAETKPYGCSVKYAK